MWERIMTCFDELRRNITRRHFFAQGSHLLGGAALATLMNQDAAAGAGVPAGFGGAVTPHFSGKVKHIIYLHMVGGPPQMDLYDYKPVMQQFYDKDLPDSVRMGQRLTTMTSGQKRFPIAPSKFKFEQCGNAGMWVCELLPWTRKMVDDMVFITWTAESEKYRFEFGTDTFLVRNGKIERQTVAAKVVTK